MSGIVSINGEIQPVEQSKISVLDRGFLFGDAIFEVLVAFHSKVIAIPEHLHRLRFSAEKIAMTLPWSDEQLTEELSDLCKRTQFPKTYLRIGITRGEGLGLFSTNSSYNKLLYALPAPRTPDSLYRQGLILKTAPKVHMQGGPQIKTPHYLPSIVAMQNSPGTTFDDVLWVNHNDEITEASTSNIFFISREDSKIFLETPCLESGLLSGVTRGILLDLFKEKHILFRETAIHNDELARFDEAFLCSTIRGIVPIQRIDDHKLSTCRPQAAFHTIQSIFHQWIEQQVGRKLDWNSGL